MLLGISEVLFDRVHYSCSIVGTLQEEERLFIRRFLSARERAMGYLKWILSLILFDIVIARRIGSITNFIFTHESSIASSVITFPNALSCDACLCAAFKSSLHYVALNCYKNNQTCSLFTASAQLTGIVASLNDSLYILSDMSLTFSSTQASNTELSTATTTGASLITSGASTTRVASTARTAINTTPNRCFLNVVLHEVICLY